MSARFTGRRRVDHVSDVKTSRACERDRVRRLTTLCRRRRRGSFLLRRFGETGEFSYDLYRRAAILLYFFFLRVRETRFLKSLGRVGDG